MEMSVWEYHLSTGALCLGERNKKGTYRNTITSCIPYSQITGALRATFGEPRGEHSLHAVGCLMPPLRRQGIVRGARDTSTGTSTLLIEAEVLVNVRGVVYIAHNEYTQDLPARFEVRLGAFRAQGLGRCALERKASGQPLAVEPAVEGRLAVRLPDDPQVLRIFGVSEAGAPVYGYLFSPDSAHIGGQYVRALFEGSRVRAPRFLLQAPNP